MSVALLPVLLLIAGAWLLGWGFRRRGELGELPDGWRRVHGTVIDLGDGAGAPPRIEYRTPDGRRLRISGPLATSFTVGQELDVLIDPEDASRARLEVAEREAVRVVRLLIGAGVVLLLIGASTAIAFL